MEYNGVVRPVKWSTMVLWDLSSEFNSHAVKEAHFQSCSVGLRFCGSPSHATNSKASLLPNIFGIGSWVYVRHQIRITVFVDEYENERQFRLWVLMGSSHVFTPNRCSVTTCNNHQDFTDTELSESHSSQMQMQMQICGKQYSHACSLSIHIYIIAETDCHRCQWLEFDEDEELNANAQADAQIASLLHCQQGYRPTSTHKQKRKMPRLLSNHHHMPTVWVLSWASIPNQLHSGIRVDAYITFYWKQPLLNHKISLY